MNTIDRIVRVIYKDLPLHEVMRSSKYSLDYTEYFKLRNDNFRRLISQQYLKTYPNNYNENEVDYMIEELADKVESKITKRTEKHNDNAINILLYVSNKLLFLNANELMSSFDDLLELNGFINKIDANILFAAKLALEQRAVLKTHKYRSLHDNTRLARILSNGISENHMHLKGSGYTTDMNWQEFFLSDNIELQEFNDIIKKDSLLETEKEILSFYKIRVLKAYLFKCIHNYETKEQDIDQVITRETIVELLAIEDIDVLLYFYQLYKNDLDQIKNMYMHQYSEFSNIKQYYLIERAFLTELFDCYLAGNMDSFTLYIFNVYLLAISKFKMLYYQDNNGMGFEKFKYSEEIKGSLLNDISNQQIYQTVFDKYYEDKHVKKIEFRIAPKNSVKEYIQLIDEIDRADALVRKELRIKKEDRLHYGIIVHYIKPKEEFKLEEGISRKENLLHDLNKKCNTFISLFTEYEELQQKLDGLPLEIDKYREKFVGIDTANYEFNCRPEVFGYIFRKQRKEIYSSHHLNFTYHVGEDFTTIADGLRAIDEVIEFLNFKRGDRFGHGLALGLDIDKYFDKKRKKMIQNVESYLDDIIWMRYMLKSVPYDEQVYLERDCNYQISEMILFLEQEFYKYFNMYHLKENYTIDDYFSAYRLRGDDPSIYSKIKEHTQKEDHQENDAFYENMLREYEEKLNPNMLDYKGHFLNPKARDLYFYYHYSSKYKALHNEMLTLPITDMYIEIVKLCQFLLRKKVYKLEIAIESNPTSNRKISSVSQYIELPFFEFNKKFLDDSSKYNLSTSINTDDGGIFQTDLTLEYAYVVATLQREGYDNESIYRYIDYIREMSLQQSFVADPENENYLANETYIDLGSKKYIAAELEHQEFLARYL